MIQRTADVRAQAKRPYRHSILLPGFGLIFLLLVPRLLGAESLPVLHFSTADADSVSLAGFLHEQIAAGDPADRQTPVGWKALPPTGFQQGYSSRAFTFRLALKNTGPDATRYLMLDNPRLDFVEFRLVTSAGERTYLTGDHNWTGKERVARPAFRFELEAGESGVIFIKVRSSSLLSFRAVLKSPEDFGAAEREMRLLEIGMGLLFFLMTGIQFYLNRRRDLAMQVYFALAMLFVGLWLWVRIGEGALFLYPRSNFLKDNGIFLLLVPAQVMLFLFFHRFLELKTVSPRVDSMVLWTAILLALSYPLYWLDTGMVFKNNLLNLGLPIQNIVLLLAFVVSIRARRVWVLHLFWGWVVSMLGVVMILLYQYNLLVPVSKYHGAAIVVVFPIWCLLLVVATARRIGDLRRERDEYLARIMDLLRGESPAASNRQSRRRVKTLDTENLREALVRLVQQERLYLDDEVTLEDFADRLGIRPDQLSALLNMEMGVSFSRFINRHRIEEACRLLREEGEGNILNIALSCGFGSKSTFNREFKRHTGLTPAAYRERELGPASR